MSKKTDRLVAQAATDAAKSANKVAASEAADRESALSSPADKAMERAFQRGTLPEKDRRAEGFAPEKQPPIDNDHIAPGSERFSESTINANVERSANPPLEASAPSVGAVPAVETQAFGVEAHPDNRVVVDAPVLQPDAPEGVPIPPLVAVSPQSAETRGPLVALAPLSEVHPSTIEAAVGFQHIPNDQINGVFEDKDGVKRDALGHPFSK